MKRLAALLLAAVLSFSLAAYQGQEAESSEMTASSAETQEQEETTETTESESGEPESTAGMEPESTEGMESEPTESGEPERNILIAYFTLGRNAEYGEDVDASASASLVPDGEELVGTTEYVARLIQEREGGDLHLIQVSEPYPVDFDTVVDQNHEEMAAGTLPELADSDLDVSQYDTVFIGYPVWAANAPQAVFSFLSQYDLSGKTIIPFCTHNGYGAGSSYGDIADAVDGEAAVLEVPAMKKWITFLSAALVMVSLTACGNGAENGSLQEAVSTDAQTEEAGIPDSEPEETEAPASGEAAAEEEPASGETVMEEASASGETVAEEAVSDEAAGEASNAGRLVAYFSYAENAALPDGMDASASASIQVWNGETTGNTGVVAAMIAEAAGADLFSIRTVEQYPDSYDATIEQGREEQSADARPEQRFRKGCPSAAPVP